MLLYSSKLGIYVMPELENIEKWHAVIFIRSGIYKHGKFKFTISFPKLFP